MIEVTEVTTRRERRAFLIYPHCLYRHDPLWVPPLIPELEERIDPARGRFFRTGQAAFFVARCNGKTKGKGRICGTIGVASNGTFGFFEHETREIAQALVAAARQWALDHDLAELRGPFNLDPEDAYGVLLEGRDRPPTLLCGHSPEQYPAVMDSLGFVPARADNIALELRLDPPPAELLRLDGLADSIRQRGGFTIRGADFGQLDREIDLVLGLMNASLAHLPDFRPVTRPEVEQMVAPFATVADPALILFAEKAGEVVAWLPGVPNLNESLGRLGGLRYPWQWLGLPMALRRPVRCLCIKSILVHPQYWSSGLGPLMIAEMYRRIRNRNYDWVDLSLTSLDNPFAPGLAQRLGARVYKRYRTYRLTVKEGQHGG